MRGREQNPDVLQAFESATGGLMLILGLILGAILGVEHGPNV